MSARIVHPPFDGERLSAMRIVAAHNEAIAGAVPALICSVAFFGLIMAIGVALTGGA